MCTDETFKIKKFLGSDWSIKDSGFIFYGPNKLEIVFSLIYIEINDFNRINRFLITHLNGTKFNEEINILFSIIKNTTDNTTIIELSIECDSDDILDYLFQYVKIPFIKKMLNNIFYKMNKMINENINNNIIIINHSFIINKNYK